MTNSVYWDSVVIVDWIENRRLARLAKIQPVVEAAIRGELLIVTSGLGMAECVRATGSDPPVDPLTPEEDEKIRPFFRSRFVEVRPVDRAIAEHARQIARETIINGPIIKIRDCIHIATAIQARCSALHTFDNRLIGASGRFSHPGWPALTISEPEYVPPQPVAATGMAGQKNLFDAIDGQVTDLDDRTGNESGEEDTSA